MRTRRRVRWRRSANCWRSAANAAQNTGGIPAAGAGTSARGFRAGPTCSSPCRAPAVTSCGVTSPGCRCRRPWSRSRRGAVAREVAGPRPGSRQGCRRGSYRQGPGRQGSADLLADAPASAGDDHDRGDGHRGTRRASSHVGREPSTNHRSSCDTTASSPRQGSGRHLSDKVPSNPARTSDKSQTISTQKYTTQYTPHNKCSQFFWSNSSLVLTLD